MGTRPDERQNRVISAVLSLIETGALPSEESYRSTVILPDGAGISYGIHQGTDASGTTDSIVLAYIDAGGLYAPELIPFLDDLASNASAGVDPNDPPQRTLDLIATLRKCGRDPIMKRVQEEVFAERYRDPVLRLGLSIGLELPISYLVLYDTQVQSGPDGIANIRKRFPALPPSRGGSEMVWLGQYLTAREVWLATFTSGNKKRQATVRRTAYRVRAIRSDIYDRGNTQLATPFTFRGTVIPG